MSTLASVGRRFDHKPYSPFFSSWPFNIICFFLIPQVTFREEGPEGAPPTALNRMDTVLEDEEGDNPSTTPAGLVVPSFDLAKMPVGGQGRGYAHIFSAQETDLLCHVKAGIRDVCVRCSCFLSYSIPFLCFLTLFLMPSCVYFTVLDSLLACLLACLFACLHCVHSSLQGRAAAQLPPGHRPGHRQRTLVHGPRRAGPGRQLRLQSLPRPRPIVAACQPSLTRTSGQARQPSH